MIAINPGTGPVPGATRRNADANMRAFVRDLREAGVTGTMRFHRFGPIEGGRYGYRLHHGLAPSAKHGLASSAKHGLASSAEHGLAPSAEHVYIDMPGLELARVRYMDEAGQDAWRFPRLYVNGDSWLWTFAISGALEALGFEDLAKAFCERREAVWIARKALADGGTDE